MGVFDLIFDLSMSTARNRQAITWFSRTMKNLRSTPTIVRNGRDQHSSNMVAPGTRNEMVT